MKNKLYSTISSFNYLCECVLKMSLEKIKMKRKNMCVDEDHMMCNLPSENSQKEAASTKELWPEMT